MARLQIDETQMTSDTTPHSAALVELPPPLTGYSWQVTWLPGRHLDRDEAITAMTIAETVAEHDMARNPLEADIRAWGCVCAWAEELGLTGAVAVFKVGSESPERGPRLHTQIAGYVTGAGPGSWPGEADFARAVRIVPSGEWAWMSGPTSVVGDRADAIEEEGTNDG
jgi:hypothetical protein